MSGFSKQNPNDRFALEKMLVPIFRRQCIIAAKNNLIDPKGFNLKEVPGRSYKIFNPVFSTEKDQLCPLLDPYMEVVYAHMLTVRLEAYDLIGEEYLFIRGYRVGHTLEGETIVVVVEAQVTGGCYLIDEDDNGRIGGDGKGRWYGVLCPSDAESELVADLKAEEARRRKLLPKCYFVRVENPDEVDTSEIS
jgi:hypothetical protein